MCLAMPGAVIEIDRNMAKIDYGGVLKEADISLIEDIRIGDYVIVHTGFAISKLDEKEALESIELWKELLDRSEFS